MPRMGVLARLCSNPALVNGVVAWARRGCGMPHQSMARIREVNRKLSESGALETRSMDSLRDLVGWLLEVSEEDAPPLVESVLAGDGSAETLDVCQTRGAGDGPTPGAPSRAKRSLKADEAAIRDTASCWSRPRLNRLRASTAWSKALPIALDAAMGGAAPPAESGELKAATDSWAGPASLGAVLEALRHIDHSAGRDVLDALLAGAQEKASFFKQEVITLVGDGLLAALAAARAAEADAASARTVAAAERSGAVGARAEAAAARGELTEQRRHREEV